MRLLRRNSAETARSYARSNSSPEAAMTETTPATPGVRDVVIVGGGPAAHRLADSLHARDGERTLRVTVVGEEPYLPYDRVALSTRLADAAADLTLQPSSMWEDGHIRLITGERVVAVDSDAH